MAEKIKILDEKNKIFEIKQGSRTIDLLSRFTELSAEEKGILVKEASEILSHCVNPNKPIGNTTGIAVGYVQSGKTMSFTTLTALAIDNSFRIIIYFAGVKLNLLEQTTKRLKKDLLTNSSNSKFFKVFESPEKKNLAQVKIKNALKLQKKPAILITVLKHFSHLDDLTEIFQTIDLKELMKETGVLIIDDEADQASLNNYARKNSKTEDWENDEFSSTYSSILKLRSNLPNHSYIQYTATPQGPLLINLMDLLSPKFHEVLTPGKNYTGGKTFFIDNPDLIVKIPGNEVFHYKKNNLSECPDSLITALQIFFLGVTLYVNIFEKVDFLSMMIHADRQQDASRKFFIWVKKFVNNWSERLALDDGDPSKKELIEEFRNNYQEATKRITSPPEFDLIIPELLETILDSNLELVISGSREIDWSNARAHILVGADMLNRGFTVEGLSVTYMPRYSLGKSNADTIQQRCRFFGYKKKYLDVCRVYLPEDSIDEYIDYIEHEEIMRGYLKEKSLNKIEQILILDSSMNPTRNNILSKDLVRYKLNGWRQINALQNIEENIGFIDNFLSKYSFKNFKDFGTKDRNHRYVKVDINSAIEFLKEFKIGNMPDALRKSSTIQYLRYLADQKQIKKVYIFEMSYQVEGGRERTLIIEKDNMKINNIFSGPSTKGSAVYPGDKGVRFEDSLCIQIHKIKIKHLSIEWGNRVLYTLGFYYPEDFAHSFVAVKP